jgi:circadian clock protein KaiB
MPDKNEIDLEKALKAGNRDKKYILHLYVAGLSPRSQTAIENVKKLCDKYLPGRYELNVHDIYQKPGSAKEAQILAAPTLVKELPPPLRKFVGDMSNTNKLMIGLELRDLEEDKHEGK